MSIREVRKLCPKCKRMYSWNPDAGRMWCPYCGMTILNNEKTLNILNKIFGKK